MRLWPRRREPQLPPPDKVFLPPEELAAVQARIDADLPPSAAVPVAVETPATVLLRYRFPGGLTVGDKKPLPSGRVYHLRPFQCRDFLVSAEDADSLLVFKGECCNSRKKQPLFERV